MKALVIVVLAIGIGDLSHGLAGMPKNRRRAYLAASLSAAVAILAGLGLDATNADGWVAIGAAIVIAVSWQLVRVGFRSPVVHLTTLGFGVLAAIMVSTIHLEEAGGLWVKYVEESRIRLIYSNRPSTTLMVFALGILLIATANAIVRTVLDVVIDGDAPATRLRGGRVIGPLERILILGFVIAGQPTTAALVVTAKSLLRYPELRAHDDVDVHSVTEYVLIGSLLSWSIALACSLAVL